MKLMKINSLSPKRLFRSKKDKAAVSRSETPSFGSGSSSTSSSSKIDGSHHNKQTAAAGAGMVTPTSVLPDVSGDWSDFSAEAASKLINDDDRVVSRKELEAVLSRLGAVAEEEVALMLSEVNCDADGCIPLQEILKRFEPALCEPAADELREAFEVFDSDHDGKISAEELLSLFTAIGDDRCTMEDCRRMIAEVDKNGDGFVCFHDFALMMELHR